MRVATTIATLVIGVSASMTFVQTASPPSTNIGGWQAPSNNPGTGSGDMPGTSMGLAGAHSSDGLLKGAYGLDLSRRIAAARKLVDEVNKGRALADSDTRSIRNLMREDFIAWNKQFDLPPSVYRAERDRWLLEPQQLKPNEWPQQRLKWLEAQRDWVIARGH